MSCFTYYLDSDFLEPHKDIIEGLNPISVLTYLWVSDNNFENLETGKVLNIYGSDASLTGEPSFQVPTKENSIVIIKGTKLYHGRPNLSDDEKVIVLNGSFYQDC